VAIRPAQDGEYNKSFRSPTNGLRSGARWRSLIELRVGVLIRWYSGGTLRRRQRTHELEARIPLGRFATVRDVAEAVAFLVSNATEYITGKAINVDGGAIMH